MDKQMFDKFEARAEIIKAMAHPTRLMIIDELSKKEHCVCELTEMAGADTSTISKHLTILKNAGIIKDEKRSQKVYYTLNIPCTLSFLSCVENVLKARAKAHMALVK
jgi:ArsR family transcriptional regulator